MHGRIFHTSDYTGEKLSGEDALAAGLTANSEHIRVMARGAASGWLEGFIHWINDEVNRPGSKHSAIIHAIAMLQTQTLASVAAQLLEPGGDKHFIKLVVELTETELVEHMARTRAGLEEAR